MSPSPTPDGHVSVETPELDDEYRGTSRRRFVGYVLAAPTLAVAAQAGFDIAAPSEASAATALLSGPQQYDLYDLSDLLTDSCKPTNHLLIIEVGRDGVATFEVPRSENGQGITTAIAMLIAEEMDLPISAVRTPLRDASPELLYNQFTGASNSIHSLYDPLRTAAAVARTRLSMAAAQQWGVDIAEVSTSGGFVHGPAGQRRLGYGELTEAAASATGLEVPVVLKAPSAFRVIGTRMARTDALAAITGAKQFAMDLKVPNALPTMVCHAPTLKGTPGALLNADAIKAMPGVTDVGLISTGVAVRARTFGQCIDAVRAMKVRWNGGTVDGYDNDRMISDLKLAELPLTPALPGAEVLEHTFTFHTRGGSPLETNTAVADVRSDRAEVWSALKSPIWAQQQFAELLGLPVDKVVVHVMQGGGSFGRKLFQDAGMEAVEATKLFRKPVKLMWHRTEDQRHGRMKTATFTRSRATLVQGAVAAFDQRVVTTATDYSHGLGEIMSSELAKNKLGKDFPAFALTGNHFFGQGVFQLTANVPYNFGEVSQLLNEIFYDYDMFATGPVRNVYSPEFATVRELMVDAIAKKLGQDPVAFRRSFLKESRMIEVLDELAERGKWGRTMAPGTAQGIAIHSEYKARIACLMEIDCRPQTVNRKVRDAYTGPRVTKVVTVADVGQPINLSGLEAQLMGGAMDGIAQTLTASLHWEDGLPLEGSWDDYRYTRQWNAPFEYEAYIVPSGIQSPGGCRELGAGVSQAAAACAYARATGVMPTEFPINFRKPLGFKVKSKSPAYPASPTNGLRFAR